MRAVINLSLPQSMAAKVDAAVEDGDFASKSEFFRHIFRFYEEEKLVREVNDSRKQILAGRGKVLRSLEDLD